VSDAATPPKGTRTVAEKMALPRPTVTLTAVLDLLEGMAAQIEGGRTDIDELALTVRAIDRRAGPEVIRISTVPSPESLTPQPSAPRPSMAVKAAKGSTAGVKWASIGLGVLTVGVQILASALTSPQQGPLVALLKVLLTALTGAQGVNIVEP
jgi:hypothetical protein